MNKIYSNPETKTLTTSGAVAYSSFKLRPIAESGKNIEGEEIESLSPKTTVGYALNEDEVKILTSKFLKAGFSNVEFIQYGTLLGTVISDTHTLKFFAFSNGDKPHISIADAKKLLFDVLKYEDKRDPSVCCVLDGLGGSIYHLKPTKQTIEKLKDIAIGGSL